MEVSLLDIAYISRYVFIHIHRYIYLCALKHYCIRTLFVLVALLLVKIFDGDFNGLNLLPTVLHISGTAQMHCYYSVSELAHSWGAFHCVFSCL